ncbi:hypothetical protein BV20DRAFT_416359 [Pilatotrama ljubarskyi]|nr:hypothetical protein BV20DRAFT_416359 [Pilatotrama ljubarskyi]
MPIEVKVRAPFYQMENSLADPGPASNDVHIHGSEHSDPVITTHLFHLASLCTLQIPGAISPAEDVAEEERHDGSTIVDGSDIGHLPPQPFCHSDVNLVRLIPAYDLSRSSPLRMECVFRGCGEFQLFGPEKTGGDGEAQGAHVSMGHILRKYSGRITSIVFDASSLPSPKSEQLMVHPLDLPFSPSTMASERHSGDYSSPIVLLPELTDLTIISNRKVSHRSLLTLLHATPMLRTLSVHNSIHYHAVLPEDHANLPRVNLPYLEKVVLKGFFAGAADEILSLLTVKPSTRVEVYLNPAFPSQPLGALQSFFPTVRHACLTYTALAQCGQAGSDRYMFTFSDIDSRFQVHWDWEASAGDPASLFHVTLGSGAALANVRQLTVSLRGVAPSFLDWITVLKPFPSLRHLDLRVTQPDPLDPLACGGCRTATFLVRAAPLLRKAADVTLMFALGLAQRFDRREAFSGDAPLIFGSSLTRKLYFRAWKHMVHKSDW